MPPSPQEGSLLPPLSSVEENPASLTDQPELLELSCLVEDSLWGVNHMFSVALESIIKPQQWQLSKVARGPR